MTKPTTYPITPDLPLLPTTYTNGLAMRAVTLAYALDRAIVEQPEEWLRGHGYALTHEFDPDVPAPAQPTKLTYHTAYLRHASTGWVFESYFRAVYDHAWRPWLEERGWEPMTEEGRYEPLRADNRDRPWWRSPSGSAYQLWDRYGGEWGGLGIALGREGFDIASTHTRALAAGNRGFEARVRRWQESADPADMPVLVVQALARAWRWGERPAWMPQTRRSRRGVLPPEDARGP